MNFKRQITKYNHYIIGDKALIGASKQMSKEEASLCLDSPMLMYEESVYGKILQLNHRDRKVITNSLEKWEKGRKEKPLFVGLYWDIVLDFILALYNMTTGDLTKEMLKTQYFQGYDEKIVFDNIEQMRSNKGSVREQGQELVRKICYYCKITEDIVRTGEGIIYIVDNNEDYTIEQVDAYCNGHNKVVLKEMIADITGVKKNEIIEVPIQVAVKRKRLQNKIYDFLDIILDEMKKNRE